MIGASNTDPLLNAYPPGTPSPLISAPCPTPSSSQPPCVLTSQYNNTRQDTNLAEPVFTTSNVASSFGATKAQFLVDASALPSHSPAFVTNPVYTQPLYVTNLVVSSGTHNALYVAALNGEVYAYDADNTSSPTKLWYRDETNTTGMQGLKHNCDVPGSPGTSVVNPLPFLSFAGVVSTPVIEFNASGTSSAILYVVNLCEKTSDSSEHWYLNALSIYTGANYASPIEIAYGASQVSAHPYGPHQQFFAAAELQRPSLLLVSGTLNSMLYKSLIAGFGTSTHEGGANATNYQGWAFAFDVNPSDATYLTLSYNQNGGGHTAYALPYITQCEYPPETVGTPYCNYNGSGSPPSATLPNPCGDGGGVWMSARAPAANANAEVFYAAGNGGFNYCSGCTNTCAGQPSSSPYWQYFTDYGEAVLETPMHGVWNTQPSSGSSTQAPFWPQSYFIPYDVPSGVTNPNNCGSSGTASCNYLQVMNDNDWDMGVSGVMIFDDNYYDGSTTQTGVSMALSATKRGDGYVMLQSNLGQYQHPDGSVTRFDIPSSHANCSTDTGTGFCDQPRTLAYWKPGGSEGEDGFLVAWPFYETATSFQWLQPSPGSQYTFERISTANNPFSGLGTGTVTGYVGGALALTVNPYDESSPAAVVWAAAIPTPNPYSSSCTGVGVQCPGYILAYKLDGGTGNLSSNQIWPSSLPSAPDFEPGPYAIPTAVNGKIYAPAYALCTQFDMSGNCIVSDGYTVSGIQVYGF